MSEGTATVRGFCFPPSRQGMPLAVESHATPTRLSDRAATALATLIPLLGCGEEAAALAFDGLSVAAGDPVAAHALATIADEERGHDQLLAAMIARLPEIDRRDDLTRAARRFHIRLGKGGGALHLARIAAIDAAVCTILSRLLRPGAPMSADTSVSAVFARIHRDESRHVRVSRTLAVTGMAPAHLRDVAAGARSALASVMGLAGTAFDDLAVDPDLLVRDIARLPNGLFAA